MRRGGGAAAGKMGYEEDKEDRRNVGEGGRNRCNDPSLFPKKEVVWAVVVVAEKEEEAQQKN